MAKSRKTRKASNRKQKPLILTLKFWGFALLVAAGVIALKSWQQQKSVLGVSDENNIKVLESSNVNSLIKQLQPTSAPTPTPKPPTPTPQRPTPTPKRPTPTPLRPTPTPTPTSRSISVGIFLDKNNSGDFEGLVDGCYKGKASFIHQNGNKKTFGPYNTCWGVTFNRRWDKKCGTIELVIPEGYKATGLYYSTYPDYTDHVLKKGANKVEVCGKHNFVHFGIKKS